MELYKPSPLALQNSFTVCDMQISFPEGFEELNAVRVAFNRRAFNAQAEMTECYEKQITSIEQLLTKGVSIMERINKESTEFAVSVLMYYGIEWVSPDAMIKHSARYEEKTRDGRTDVHGVYWENTFNDLINNSLKPIYSRVKNVTDYQRELSFQRQIQRASRSQWRGGGFGFKGAVKGAMMAGMMNAGTGVFRGIGDSFADVKDAGRVQVLKDAIIDGGMPLANYNYIVRTYVHHLFEITQGYLLNSFCKYSEHHYKGEPKLRYRKSKKDIEEAVSKFQNYELFYKKGAKTANEVKKAIIEYLVINIWDINAYRSLYLLSETATDKKSLIYTTTFLGLQYEFANIALNIDLDLIEDAEEKKVSESELNRIRKEVEERTELIDFIISSNDEQLESRLMKQSYINKNGYYIEKTPDFVLDSFTQEEFKLSATSTGDFLALTLSYRESPYNGKIKLTLSNLTYEGNFEDGRVMGLGRAEIHNGSIVEGEFDNGNMVSGKLVKEAFTYEGEVIFDKEAKFHRRNGKGLTVYNKGGKLEGNYVFDKIDGYGKVTYANGDVFEGNFIDESQEGSCKFTTQEYVFTGECANGKMVSGTVEFKNGSSYEGDIENNVVGPNWSKSGVGIFTYTDGQSYHGSWQNDKRHGQGVLKDRDGTIIYSGEWVNDARKTGGLLTKFKDKFKGL